MDDIIYIASSQDLIDHFKLPMISKFDLTYLGVLYYFLGLFCLSRWSCIFIYQNKYVLDMLKNFSMLNCNTSSINTIENLSRNDRIEIPKLDSELTSEG